MEAVKFDNIHYTSTKIDGTQKPFRYVVSLRGPGKSTFFHVRKAWRAFHEEGKATIMVRRQIVDITDGYIDSLRETLAKFGIIVDFSYHKGDKKEGIIDIREKSTKRIFYRILALSVPPSRHKSLILRNVAYMCFDEFICNPDMGESYLPSEVLRFKEIYNTYWRESPDMICYFLGNLYSWFNPYFASLGVKPTDFKSKSVISGDNWAVEFYTPSAELKEMLMKNPLYVTGDKYTQYALEGIAINDQNAIIIERCPQGFALKYQFKVEDKYYQIWKKEGYIEGLKYWICSSEVSRNRQTFAFDFKDLAGDAILFSYSDKIALKRFSQAVYANLVGYKDLDCYYMMKEIYKKL